MGTQDDGLQLGFGIHQRGRAMVVEVAGEIDLNTSAQLRRELTRLLAEGHRYLVIDLSEVAFCDASGVGVLVRTWRQVRAEGGWLRLAAPRPPVQRVLNLTGLAKVLPVFPRLTGALVGVEFDPVPAGGPHHEPVTGPSACHARAGRQAAASEG